MRSRTARRLVETGRVLPVLDGLDEMGRESADWKPDVAGALTQLSESPWMLKATKRGPVILTCLDTFYEGLVPPGEEGIALREAVVIRIDPVSASDVKEFLAGRFRNRPDLDPLSEPAFDEQLKDRDSPLATALGSPLILALAVSVLLAGLSQPRELAELGSPGEISAYLLGKFIPAATKLVPRNVRAATQIENLRNGLYDPHASGARHYDNAQVQQWLTTLALFLHDYPSPGNEISPIRLWKIGGTTTPRIVHAAIGGYLDSGPAAAVSSGSAAALAGAVLAGLNRGISGDVLPWQIISNDLLFGLSLGLAPAVAAGLPHGLNGGLAARLELNTHLTVAGSAGLAIVIGLLGGVALGSRSWLRQAIAITLVAPSGRLPWRTQRFLEWAYLAGLLRISGITYQFRHDELRRVANAALTAGEKEALAPAA